MDNEDCMGDCELIAFVMLIEALLHYIPWREYLKGHDLPRPIAYALGVSGLMVPFTVWLYKRNEINVALHLWAVILTGGIAVLAAYGADAIKDLYWKEREATEREIEARKKRDV